MKLITLILIFTFSVFNSCDSFAGESQLEKYVAHFHQNVSQSRLNRALKYIPMVETESTAAGFDPVLIGVLISLESSWLPDSLGKIGEKGFLQVVPDSVCSKGFDLDDTTQSLRAGLNCLKMHQVHCDGTLEQTLTSYASGRCRSKSERTKRMIKRRIRIVSFIFFVSFLAQQFPLLKL